MRGRAQPFPWSRLPRLTRTEARLGGAVDAEQLERMLERAAGELGRRMGRQPVRVRVARVEGVATELLPARFPGRWLFGMLSNQLANRTAFVVLDENLLEKIARTVSPRSMPAMHGGLHGAAAALGASLVAELGKDTACASVHGWRWCGVTDSLGQLCDVCAEDSNLAALWFELRVGSDGGFAVWLEPESSLNHAAVTHDERPVPEWLPDALWVDLPIEAGRCTCTPSELAALAAGDVLLLGQADAAYRIAIGKKVFYATAQGCRLRIDRMCTEEGGDEMKVEDVTGSVDSSADTAELPALPVELCTELGRIRMTLGQVARLRPGNTIELGQALAEPVQIRAGGRLVAVGELVNVDGRRGVRLTEVYLQRKRP